MNGNKLKFGEISLNGCVAIASRFVALKST